MGQRHGKFCIDESCLMTTRHLIMEKFRENASPRTLFSREPRLTLTQAFNIITKELPMDASIIFQPYKGGITPDIHPFCGPVYAIDRDKPEPTHLCYELRPDLHSAIIHRIKVAGERGLGIGTALMASQYPLWQKLDVQALAVHAHEMSEGFYAKLGFRRMNRLPEFDVDATVLTMLRLDLTDPAQKAQFESAIQRHPASALKNSGLTL